MSTRPIEVDQIARSLWNRAALAVGMNDRDEAFAVCRDLGAIEAAYELRLKNERFDRGAPTRRTSNDAPRAAVQSKFTGRPIASKFAGRCKVCGGQYAEGDEVLWCQGAGCAHLDCGEIG